MNSTARVLGLEVEKVATQKAWEVKTSVLRAENIWGLRRLGAERWSKEKKNVDMSFLAIYRYIMTQ